MITKLPENYGHTMGFDYGGYWAYACSEGGEFILVERKLGQLLEILEFSGINIEGEVEKMILVINKEMEISLEKYRAKAAARKSCMPVKGVYSRELARALEDEDRAAFELASIVDSTIAKCERA